MKKITVLILALVLVLAGLAGCSGTIEVSDGGEAGEVVEPADGGETGETGDETGESADGGETDGNTDGGENTEAAPEPAADAYDALIAAAKNGACADGVWSWYYEAGDDTTNGVIYDEASGALTIYMNIDRQAERGMNVQTYLSVGRGQTVCPGRLAADVTQEGMSGTVTANFQIDPATFTADTAITTTDRKLSVKGMTVSVPSDIVQPMEELLPGTVARSLNNLERVVLRDAGCSLADLGFAALG